MVAGEFSGFTIASSFRMNGKHGAPPASSGMKSFMNGMISPFTACWQPDPSSCVPGCSSDYHCGSGRPRSSNASVTSSTSSSPAVVSPLMDRMAQRYSRGAESHRSPIVSPSRHHSSEIAHYPPEKQPTSDIEKPHSNDVLCGRGGSSNRHLGNMHFRELVAANKKMYIGLTKKQKMMVARKIVEMVHTTSPPGRFLAKDLDTGLWYDIGLPRSLEKTSQALREKNSNDYPVLVVDAGPGEEGTETISDVLSDASHASIPTSPRSDGGAASPEVGCDKSTKSISSSARNGKNVEAPPLTIPSNLTHIFGPKKYNQEPTHPWSPEHGHVPRHPSHLDPPHLNSYPSSPGSHYDDRYHSLPPRSRPFEMSSPHSPPHYPSHHHHPPAPHYRFPPPRHHFPHGPPPPHQYGESERHPQYRPRYGGPESPPRLDYREQHNEYYSRRPDPREPYVQPPPHRAPPPAHYGAYPPPPPPPGPPPSSSRLHRRPGPHHQTPSAYRRQPHHYPPSPSAATPPMSPMSSSSSVGGIANEGMVVDSRESKRSSPPSSPPPMGDIRISEYPSAESKKAASGGYVRSKAEVSPGRRQEHKRLRKETGAPQRLTSDGRVTSDASLSHAVENSLTLEERVVGRERHSQKSMAPLALGSAGLAPGVGVDKTMLEGPRVLQSPSAVLQGRSKPRSRSPQGDAETEAAAALSGLAALSTAAFLKLDETN